MVWLPSTSALCTLLPWEPEGSLGGKPSLLLCVCWPCDCAQSHRSPPSSAFLHLDDFLYNDCHSHNYNNYRGNNMILNGWRVLLLRMLMCVKGGQRGSYQKYDWIQFGRKQLSAAWGRPRGLHTRGAFPVSVPELGHMFPLSNGKICPAPW